MKRILTLVAASVLGLSLLTGCGEDGVGGIGGQDYCDLLKDTKAEIDSLGEGEIGNIEELRDTMQDLADAAPDDIADDWEILIDGFDQLLQALEDAGISAEDFEKIQNGEIPPDVDMEKLQEAFAEMETLNSEEFATASENISKHAKDECDVDLDA